MKTLQEAVQKRLKQRKLYKQGIGLVALSFFKPYALYPTQLKVTIRGTSCQIKLAPEEDRQGWYLQKQKLLEDLLIHLRKQGRETIISSLKIS